MMMAHKHIVFQLHLAARACERYDCDCGHPELGVHAVHDDANGDDAVRHRVPNQFGSVSGHLDLQ